jgi:hypothetical protein
VCNISFRSSVCVSACVNSPTASRRVQTFSMLAFMCLLQSSVTAYSHEHHNSSDSDEIRIGCSMLGVVCVCVDVAVCGNVVCVCSSSMTAANSLLSDERCGMLACCGCCASSACMRLKKSSFNNRTASTHTAFLHTISDLANICASRTHTDKGCAHTSWTKVNRVCSFRNPHTRMIVDTIPEAVDSCSSCVFVCVVVGAVSVAALRCVSVCCRDSSVRANCLMMTNMGQSRSSNAWLALAIRTTDSNTFFVCKSPVAACVFVCVLVCVLVRLSASLVFLFRKSHNASKRRLDCIMVCLQRFVSSSMRSSTSTQTLWSVAAALQLQCPHTL